MHFLIEQNPAGYTIIVREWAQKQLGRDIKHTYKHRANAVRAVRDDSRNTTTLLCQLAWKATSRAEKLELILLRLTKELKNHSFDVGSIIGDVGSASTDDFGVGEGSKTTWVADGVPVSSS